MSMNRIAAAATVIVLGVSGVALAQGGIDLSAEQSTEASANANVPTSVPSTNADFGLSVAAEATSSTSTAATRPTTTTANDDRSRRDFATTTTIDDRSRRDFATTTTIDDSSNERRTVVELGLRTYTVGEAGTVTVDRMTLLAVDANVGWTVEIKEVSTDKIKVRFHQGEQHAEFELRIDGELRIRSAHS